MASTKNLQLMWHLMVKIWVILFRDRNKGRMPAFTTSTLHCYSSPSHWGKIREKKDKKKNWKEKRKLSLFVNDMIFFHRESPKESIKTNKNIYKGWKSELSICETCYILIYWQQIIAKWNLLNFIYSSIKKIKY